MQETGLVMASKADIGTSAITLPHQLQFEAAPHDFDFIVLRRIGQPMTQHEAIQLGFRQFERARLLDRVLRSDHQKGAGNG